MAEKYYYLSPYAFCNNNPVIFVDPDGEVIDTAWDAANVAMDVTSLVANAASGNIPGAVVDAASLAIDAVAAVIPGLPGGAGTVVKALRSPEKAKAALEGFKVAGEFGIGTYRKLRKAVVERFGKGSGLEVHHLIEQRLAGFLGVDAKDIPSIVLTKDEHRIFTNAWREKIPYGSGKDLTADDIYKVAYEIYEEYKEILEQIVKLKK